MSSDGEDFEDDIATRHKKEKKELKAKILTLKKAAKTGNKLKQKETNAQCERLEKELEERQKQELFEKKQAKEAASPAPEAPPASETTEPKEEGGFYKNLLIGKKQAKRQAKKEEAELKWKEAMKEDREAAKGSEKAIEKQIIIATLLEHKLRMVEVMADGDCLYNALSHQLFQNGVKTDSTELRKTCAQYMRENKDDFMPFIAAESAAEPSSPDDPESEWIKYLKGVENTTEHGGVWGGELELNALSRKLRRVIEVFKTDGMRRYGEEFEGSNKKPLRIVYLRKAFKLGEHYNSTSVVS